MDDPTEAREMHDSTLLPYLIDEVRDVRADVREVRTSVRDVEISLRSEIRDAVNRLLAFMGLLFAAQAILLTIFQFALN